eukprot:TRINITY_DN43125_c0_g1_i1.p1 TRINITY_DN43125_c0_g1~~TRINITY_DN43125_c0_g1_i1.p1  ORF type:complete len:298 (-),score=64.90 TRINITY_DN43125_c0_g1_i1:21-914(-)
MLRSLVGSEMCIRDSSTPALLGGETQVQRMQSEDCSSAPSRVEPSHSSSASQPESNVAFQISLMRSEICSIKLQMTALTTAFVKHQDVQQRSVASLSSKLDAVISMLSGQKDKVLAPHPPATADPNQYPPLYQAEAREDPEAAQKRQQHQRSLEQETEAIRLEQERLEQEVRTRERHEKLRRVEERRRAELSAKNREKLACLFSEEDEDSQGSGVKGQGSIFSGSVKDVTQTESRIGLFSDESMEEGSALFQSPPPGERVGKDQQINAKPDASGPDLFGDDAHDADPKGDLFADLEL